MPLSVGTKAPNFTLSTKAADGPKQAKLSDNFGKKNTLLLFFPMAFTGTCTTEMCEVSQGMNAYTDLNAIVYGISGDNPFAQEAWAQKEKITVPLLSELREDQSEAGRTEMTHALNVISNGVRDLTIGAWITLGNLRDFISLCGLLRFAQDDQIENERRI